MEADQGVDADGQDVRLLVEQLEKKKRKKKKEKKHSGNMRKKKRKEDLLWFR